MAFAVLKHQPFIPKFLHDKSPSELPHNEQRNHLIIDAKIKDDPDPSDLSKKNITWITAPNTLWGHVLWFCFRKHKNIQEAINHSNSTVNDNILKSLRWNPLRADAVWCKIQNLTSTEVLSTNVKNALKETQPAIHSALETQGEKERDKYTTFTRKEITSAIINLLSGPISHFQRENNRDRRQQQDKLEKLVVSLVVSHAPLSLSERFSFHEKTIPFEEAEKICKEILLWIAHQKLKDYEGYGKNPYPTHYDNENRHSTTNQTYWGERVNFGWDQQAQANRIFGDNHPIVKEWEERCQTAQRCQKKIIPTGAPTISKKENDEEQNNTDYKVLLKAIPDPEEIDTLEQANNAIKDAEHLIAFIERADNAAPEKSTYPWAERKSNALKMLKTVEKKQKEEQQFEKYASLDERESTSTARESEISELESKASPITANSIIEEKDNQSLSDSYLFKERDTITSHFKKTNTLSAKIGRALSFNNLNFFRRKKTSSSSSNNDDRIQ